MCHQHQQGYACAEDIASVETIGGLVSTSHACSVACGPGGGATAGKPSLGGLVAGGGIVGEVGGEYRRHVLGGAEVAQAGPSGRSVKENVLGLFVVNR